MNDDNRLPVNEPRLFCSTVVAYAFTCIAGYVDAYALMHFSVYASFMSGNTTRAGVEVATEKFSDAALSLLAVGFFLIGAFVGVAILHSRHRSARRSVVIFALALLVVQAAADLWSPNVAVAVAILCASMGALNSTVSRIGGQSVNIGYVSGALHKVAEHLAFAYRRLPVESSQGPSDTHFRRAGLILGMWGTFLVGAFLGALIQRHYPRVVLSVPIGAMLVVLLSGAMAAPAGRDPELADINT